MVIMNASKYEFIRESVGCVPRVHPPRVTHLNIFGAVRILEKEPHPEWNDNGFQSVATTELNKGWGLNYEQI